MIFCKSCGKEIFWNGKNWDHKGDVKPRHMAVLDIAKHPVILRPDEVESPGIPQEVFNLFNKMIKEKWLKGQAKLSQGEVVKRVADLFGMNRQEVFDMHWLDIEEYYEQAGWSVVYDKPAYNEDYKAYWVFTAPPSGE